MSAQAFRTRAVLVGACCVAIVSAGIVASDREPAGAGGAVWPAPRDIDTLARYLEPVSPAPPLDDYAAFIPAAPRPVRAEEPSALPPQAPPRSWRLTAVLIAGDRPTAILNDQQVVPGAVLEGGGRVESIARDHVVIRESNGVRRTIWLVDAVEGAR